MKLKRFDSEQFLRNRHNHLLTALIVLFVISPSLEVRDEVIRFPVVPLLLLLVLVTALRVELPEKRIWRWIASSVIGLGFGLNLAMYFFPDLPPPLIRSMRVFSALISVVFYSAAVFFLSRRLFRVREVNADTIKAGVGAYLLLGFIWATLYGLLIHFDPHALTVNSGGRPMLVHFSFTTLTTLGYGDIVPATRIAAVLADGEALAGQLYLAIFVARLIGLYIQNAAAAPAAEPR
jgi:hypothetical protein